MKETNPKSPGTWTRPLEGYICWIGWAALVLALAGITWLVLGLANQEFYRYSTAPRWLLSFGIGLALALFLRFLAACLCSWRNFKRLLLGLACFAGLVAFFYAEEDLRGWLAWRHFKSHWEARGEKFNFADVIPPPVPDDQNFAMAPVVTTAYSRILDRNGSKKTPPDTNVTVDLQMPLDGDNDGPSKAIGNWQKAVRSNLEPWQLYYRDLAETTNLFPVAAQPQSPAADVLLALSKYGPTIEKLREAAARPASRFPLNYHEDEPFSILLPHLAPLKGCATVLRLRALAELQARQSEAALADIRLALDLTGKIRSEPFLISHLVRIAMFQITEQAIWEGLSEHRWNDAQLRELDQELARFDFVADYVSSLRGENACQVATVNFLRHHRNLLDHLGDSRQDRSLRFADLCGYFIPSGWFYQNQLRSSQFMLERFMPVADVAQQTFSVSLVDQAVESLSAMPRTPYTMISKMLLPGLTRSSHRFAFAQAALDLARCACALERYHLVEGKYPDKLEALAPRFIEKIPVDPMGGQPLRYRTEPDGNFVLYSVGWDGTDDGGQVFQSKSGVVKLDQGDWVWRYPPSPNL